MVFSFDLPSKSAPLVILLLSQVLNRFGIFISEQVLWAGTRIRYSECSGTLDRYSGQVLGAGTRSRYCGQVLESGTLGRYSEQVIGDSEQVLSAGTRGNNRMRI